MKHILRELIEAGYAIFVMVCIGKWALYYAYLERGYRAVGGEYCLILMVYWIAYKVIHYTFDALEELEHEQNNKKEELEELLGMQITEEQFEEALGYAKQKQIYIFQREKRLVVMKRRYLIKLTEEYIRNLAFSRFTMDLCRTLSYMEKEHSTKSQSTPTDNHIVQASAL